MKNILLIPNRLKDKDLDISLRVASLLSKEGACVYIESKYYDELKEYTKPFSDSSDIDLVIVIGGDGSILDAAKYAIERKIPILGVNLGKVGYLSEVELDNISDLKKLFSGEFSVEDKMLLEAEAVTGGVSAHSDRLALNDIIIGHDTFLGIAEFKLEKSGGETVKYRADGIIFSTPVGSTAYSLSAGGPIVSHGANAIIVTPIAPHSFFNRSIVFGENEEIRIKNTSTDALNLSLDGRFCHVLSPGEKCTVKASSKKIKVLTFKENNMFSNLFCKMQIMEDII